MGEHSAISWTDASWAPIRARNRVTGKVGWHCEHASPGCIHCYSETFNERRLGTGLPFKPGHRGDVEHFLDEKMLLAPFRWRRPRRIFVCSMTDLFGDWVPDAWIDRVFAVMALAPHHTMQILTKRSARMRAYMLDTSQARRDGRGSSVAALQPDVPLETLRWPLPNVWLGVSAEDQRRADERIPDLLATPAAMRFVSAEPLLGPLDIAWAMGHQIGIAAGFQRRGQFAPGLETLHPLDWIIVGGESGTGARPMHPQWACSIRDQCAKAGVPFHFKQWGEMRPYADDRADCSWFDPDGHFYGGPTSWPPTANERRVAMVRVGKARAGRLLDGIEHNGMPPAALRRAQGDAETGGVDG